MKRRLIYVVSALVWLGCGERLSAQTLANTLTQSSVQTLLTESPQAQKSTTRASTLAPVSEAVIHSVAPSASPTQQTQTAPVFPALQTDTPAPTGESGVSSQIKDMFAPSLPEHPALELKASAQTSLRSSSDLWDRIRRGFGMNNLDDVYVSNREQWYAARPDYIARMTERSKKYLYHIMEEVQARGLPSELALLPFVESAFNPDATSTAKAAGMWQFIPSTGKQYSLKQNMFRDDRRDVLASTRAALDYLQKLYEQFGDWHLALAGYNWGEGNVARAIAKNQKMGLPTGYQDLKMPAETRDYVPKLQAIKNIINNPEQYNTTLESVADHPYFRSVPIKRDLDIQLAAKLAQVPLADFKALNPSLSRPVILASGTTQVLMPWDNAELFNNNLENYRGQLASWTAWIVPTALKPKEAASRVGLSEARLREVNGLGLKTGLIQAGSTLLVPRTAHKQEDVTASIAENGQITMFTPKAKSKVSAKHKNTAQAQKVQNPRKTASSRTAEKVTLRKAQTQAATKKPNVTTSTQRTSYVKPQYAQK